MYLKPQGRTQRMEAIQYVSMRATTASLSGGRDQMNWQFRNREPSGRNGSIARMKGATANSGGSLCSLPNPSSVKRSLPLRAGGQKAPERPPLVELPSYSCSLPPSCPPHKAPLGVGCSWQLHLWGKVRNTLGHDTCFPSKASGSQLGALV